MRLVNSHAGGRVQQLPRSRVPDDPGQHTGSRGVKQCPRGGGSHRAETTRGRALRRAGGGREVCAQAVDRAGKTLRERFELPARHRSEERSCESLVVALERGDERLASGREGHQRRSPVGRVGLARHEPLRNDRIDEAGHGSCRHVQRFREHSLGDRAALSQLPEQVSASRSEPERGVRLRHVAVQHDDELEDAIEETLILLYRGYSEA